MKSRAWLTVILALTIGACGSDGGAGGLAGDGGPGSFCHTDSDCKATASYLYCSPTGQSGGGACFCDASGPVCTQDLDCQGDGGSSTMICEQGQNSCPGACSTQKHCRQGCTSNAACGEGQQCGATHRCEALTCGAGSPCPQNFDCGSGICARRTCTSDAECAPGYCVVGACYSNAGMCQAPAA